MDNMDEFRRAATAAFFRGTSLVKVSIGAYLDATALQAVIRGLADGSPKIEHFFLDEPADFAEFDWCDVDCSPFRGLKRVHLLGVGLGAWQNLEGCPVLEEVVLNHWRTQEELVPLDRLITLPSLHTLSINDQPCCYPILLGSVMPRLTNLTVAYLDDGDGSLVTLIGGRSPLLKGIDVFEIRRSTTVQTLKAFSVLRNISSVKLGYSTRLDDRAVDQLARALPRLRTLVMTGPKPDITGKSLLSLIRHCGEITGLALPMDLSEFDSPHGDDLLASSVGPSTTLRRLTLEQVVLPEKLDRVVQSLGKFCPNIRLLALCVPGIGPANGPKTLQEEFEAQQEHVRREMAT